MNRKLIKTLARFLAVLLLLTDIGNTWIQNGGLSEVHAEEAQEEQNTGTDYLAKAEELGTPLAVYNYLKNNVHYEYYQGRRKGAEAVYDSMGGNDVDQALLLSGMLNHLGYETRYVSGRIRLDAEKLRALTGEADMADAAGVMAMSGNTTLISDEDNNALYVETDHIWVEARIPYTDYRGSGIGGGDFLWIPLDTGIKAYEEVENVYDRLDGLSVPDSVSGGNMGYIQLQNQVRQTVAENPDTYLTRRVIAGEELKYLPLSLQYPVLEIYERFEDADHFATDSICFTLNGCELGELIPEEMYGKRLVLAYEENEDGTWRGRLKLDGETIAEGGSVSLGENELFRMAVTSDGETQVVDNTIPAGGMYQITCDTQNITERELGLALNQWKTLQETANEGNVLKEETLGILLDYAGKAYFAQVDLADRVIAEQTDVHATRDLSVGIMGYRPVIQENTATNEKILSGRGSLYADIDLDIHRTAEQNGAAKEFMLLAGMMSSYYESIIWEQLTGLSSVSTMALFADAAEDGTEFRILTGENFEAERESLCLDGADIHAIQQKLEEGKVVLAPCREQTLADWTGAAYLVLDRESYAGEYMISGGLSGEGVNGGSSCTAVGTAYLLNIVLTAIDMAQAVCMIPHIVTLLSAATPLGFITAIVVGSLVTSLLVFSMMYLADTVALMDAYLEGEEGAGEEMVSSAFLNLATTVTVGLGSKAVGAAIKGGTKKVVGKVVGEEVAERLVEESASTRGLIRSIGKLQDMGFADDVIREFAQTLETESFETLGTLARKGMSPEMTAALAGNGAAIKNVTDSMELLVFKNTVGHADDVARLLGEKGDDFVRVYRRFGDPAVDVLVRCGSDAIGELDTYGVRFLGLVDSYGDDFVGLYGKYGSTAVERCLEHGDDVMGLVGKYGDDCADLVMRYGDDVVEGISRHGDEFLERYAKEGDAFVGEYLEKGDAVFEGGSNITQDLVKESLCSNDELYRYLLSNVDEETAQAFLDSGKWPDGVQIPKNSSVLNADGTINWTLAPEGGYTLDADGKAVREMFTPQMGEIIDRYGSANGRYTSPVIDGKSFAYTERLLPYVEDLSNYHQYEVIGDFSRIEEYLEKCTDMDLKTEVDMAVYTFYDGNYSNLVSYRGQAAGIEGWGIGGAIQYEFALTVQQLEGLGLLREIK